MRKQKAAPIRIILTAVIALVCAIAAVAAGVLPAGAAETQQYEKRTTYVADFENGIDPEDPNWDLLYNAYITGGKLAGTSISESGYYGIGFRRRTPAKGTTVISAEVTIPEAENNKNGFLEFGLRLGDYTDNKTERKGIRVCVEGGGKIGIISALGKVISCQQTKYTFTEGRRIYIEDNADTNIITVFVDDGGQKVRVAECTIQENMAFMEYPDEGLETVTVNYDHEIHREGYIALNTDGKGVYISSLSVTIPSFSTTPYAQAEETIIGSGSKADEEQTEPEDSKDKAESGSSGGVDPMLIVYPAIALVLAAVIAVLAVMLVKMKKKSQN